MNKNYMDEAYVLAQQGKYFTYRNPLVGAVIVKDNIIIGKGYHHAFGKEHAEINAISNVKNKDEIAGSTMYVTLEPCSHYGKTPPCCNQIVKMGIKKVVIGQLDPNPITSGKGLKYLKDNGVEVIINNNTDKIRTLNTHYNHFYEKGRPFITLKYASTLNGKINENNNVRSIITGNEVFNDVQNQRKLHQSILVGSETILVDNPLLSIRTYPKPLYPPIKIIIDRRGRLSLKENVFKDTPTWVFTCSNKFNNINQNNTNIKIFYNKHWDINNVVKEIYNMGIQSIFVEGGSKIHNAFLESNLIDMLHIYYAPKLFGGNSINAVSNPFSSTSVAKKFKYENITLLGEDLKVTALPV